MATPELFKDTLKTPIMGANTPWVATSWHNPIPGLCPVKGARQQLLPTSSQATISGGATRVPMNMLVSNAPFEHLHLGFQDNARLCRIVEVPMEQLAITRVT
jgi:hypothetical protein